MKQSPQIDGPTRPIQSPHPGLQAILPRLRSIGPRHKHRPVFDSRSEVRDYLKERESSDAVHIVPVWAIDHSDLMRSEIVNWTFAPHLH